MSSVNLKDPVEARAVFNWENQIPMWDSDNKAKKDRISTAAQRLFDRLLRECRVALKKEQRQGARP